MSYPAPQELSVTFAAKVREWVAPEDVASIDRLNAAESDRNICHSHDYCDTNMAMHESMVQSGVPENDLLGDTATVAASTLWNDAWNIAKSRGFAK